MLRGDGLLDARGDIDLQRDGHLGMRAVEVLDHRRHEAEPDRGQRRHVQMARLSRADARGHFADLVDRDEGALDLVVEDLRLRRGREPALGAVEEREVELLLEPPEQSARGGLRHAEQHRGTAHGARLHGRPEGLELSDEHATVRAPALQRRIMAADLGKG